MNTYITKSILATALVAVATAIGVSHWNALMPPFSAGSEDRSIPSNEASKVESFTSLFIKGADSPIRLTPREIADLPFIDAGAGTSGVKGIETRVLKGDPTKSGLYTIELRVPAHTKIAAHSHLDDRVATVVSGTWHFGYGTRFDVTKLKALPSGSFYTEPAGEPHFAETGPTAVVVDISGMGPTGTHYIGAGDSASTTRSSTLALNGLRMAGAFPLGAIAARKPRG